MWPAYGPIGLGWPAYGPIGLSWPAYSVNGLGWPAYGLSGLDRPAYGPSGLDRPAYGPSGLADPGQFRPSQLLYVRSILYMDITIYGFCEFPARLMTGSVAINDGIKLK